MLQVTFYICEVLSLSHNRRHCLCHLQRASDCRRKGEKKRGEKTTSSKEQKQNSTISRSNKASVTPEMVKLRFRNLHHKYEAFEKAWAPWLRARALEGDQNSSPLALGKATGRRVGLRAPPVLLLEPLAHLRPAPPRERGLGSLVHVTLIRRGYGGRLRVWVTPGVRTGERESLTLHRRQEKVKKFKPGAFSLQLPSPQVVYIYTVVKRCKMTAVTCI